MNATLISAYIVPLEHLNTQYKELPLDQFDMLLSVVVEGHLNQTHDSLLSVPQIKAYYESHSDDGNNIFMDFAYLKLDASLNVDDLSESYFDDAYNQGLIKVVSKSGIFLLTEDAIDISNRQLVSICNCTLLAPEITMVSQITPELLAELDIDAMFDVKGWVSFTDNPNVFDVEGVFTYLTNLSNCAGRIVVIEVMHVAVDKDVNLNTADSYIELISQKKAILISTAATSLKMDAQDEDEIVDTMVIE